MTLRAAFFDVGDTLIAESVERFGGDSWRQIVLDAIGQEFGESAWAEPLYSWGRAWSHPEDLKQETCRWIGEQLAAHGENFTDTEIDRLRAICAPPLDLVHSLAPGAADALRWCKAQGLVTVIVTNTFWRGDAEVLRDWQRYGLSGAIDHVVSSQSTGWIKPHRAMFDRALSLAGVAPSEAFMVGDNFTADVLGAQAVGIRTIWKPVGAPKYESDVRPDAVISSLEELPAVVSCWLTPG